WFALALLIFSGIYTLVRLTAAIFPKKAAPAGTWAFSNLSVIILGLVISAAAFTIRVFLPIGTSFFNMQLCYFAQYIVLFIIGILSYRLDIFSKVPPEEGMNWFRNTLRFGIPLWGAIMILGGVLSGGLTKFNGGLTWQSAAYSLWESFFCI